MIYYRCDRCPAEEQAGKTGAMPKGWTLGMGCDLCPECSRQKVTADEAKERETT